MLDRDIDWMQPKVDLIVGFVRSEIYAIDQRFGFRGEFTIVNHGDR
jgi:hypothetical protein